MNTEIITTTRYGRQVKKPVRYEPVETCTDDYTDEECESEEEIESETDEEESDTDSDADEHGNLSNFVTYNDEDEDE
jgi:hypothetical protein